MPLTGRLLAVWVFSCVIIYLDAITTTTRIVRPSPYSWDDDDFFALYNVHIGGREGRAVGVGVLVLFGHGCTARWGVGCAVGVVFGVVMLGGDDVGGVDGFGGVFAPSLGGSPRVGGVGVLFV